MDEAMDRFFRWLIGIKESSEHVEGGSWTVQFNSMPQGIWSAAAIAAAVLAAVGVWWLYRREGRTIRLPTRLTLVALRLIVLGCVACMLLELVLVITKKELIRSQLIVLVDDSESMGLKDPY